jgi:hypothetical protein
MSEQEPGRSVPDQTKPDEAALHVASGDDATEARQRADRLVEILDRGDARDRAAERRDRDADGRDPWDSDASVDRDWSGRDRDLAAGDRADLIELLQPHESVTSGDEGHPDS